MGTSVLSQSLHLGLVGLGLVVLGLGLALGLALRVDVGALVMVILSVVNTRNEPMALKLLRVVPTPGLSKKYAAVFLLPNGRQRTVRFGTASNYVSNERKTARARAAYGVHRTAPREREPRRSAHTRRAVEVAAVGREQEPGSQHGGVQAALPLAVRCASRETGPTDLPQTCRAAAEGQLLQDPREIDITCPSRLRELGRRSQDMPRFATARLDPHPFFFFLFPSVAVGSR